MQHKESQVARGMHLLLRLGLLVDIREDVDLVEAQAEFAQQRHDPAVEKGTNSKNWGRAPAAELEHPHDTNLARTPSSPRPSC